MVCDGIIENAKRKRVEEEVEKEGRACVKYY